MAHYAFLDENNIVTEVIVGKNEGEDGKTGEEWEAHYGAFRGQTCKRTSYNTHGGIYYTANKQTPSQDQSKSFRKNFASIGFSYDAVRDAFIPEKPFNSWVLNEDHCLWNPPIDMPNDGLLYIWNEDNISWEQISEDEDVS